MQLNNKSVISLAIIFLCMPLLLLLGATVLEDRQYYFISIGIIVLGLLLMFITYEKKNPEPKEVLLISLMTALTVVGRLLFATVPGFKPVAALTAITGFSLGAEAGFLTGALSALLSNMFFGQGPWTPFQMFAWGLIGFIAGLLPKIMNVQKKTFLICFGIVSAVFYSFAMDVWGTVSATGIFTFEAYFAALLTAIPFTAMYAASNILFLLLLTKPVMKKLSRMKKKYGLFNGKRYS